MAAFMEMRGTGWFNIRKQQTWRALFVGVDVCIIHVYMGRQHKTLLSKDIRSLHEALLDLTGVISRLQPDAGPIAAACVDLNRALFPLLVCLEQCGPIGVGELADLAGRDYTTVSRQVAKLEGFGLVWRRASQRDRQVREASVTPTGRAIIRTRDAAREKIVAALLIDWEATDVQNLAWLLRGFADEAVAWTAD